MSEYGQGTKPKPTLGYPLDAQKDGVSGFGRTEPFMNVQRLKDEFLFGIPLYSFITGEKISDETLKSIIRRSAAKVETKCRISIFPIAREKRIDFDLTKYRQGFLQMNLGACPILSLEEVSIRLSNSSVYPYAIQTQGNESGELIYTFPLEWVNLSLASKGILTMTPIGVSGLASGGMATIGTPTADIAGAALLGLMNKANHYPGFWLVRWTSGFNANSIPSEINTLIANYATIELLSMVSNTNIFSGKSIGLDGASQSVSTAGPAIFKERIDLLAAENKDIEDRLRKHFGPGIWMQHI